MLIISLIILQVIIFVVLILVFRTIMTQNVSKATTHLEALNQEYVRKEEEAHLHVSQAQQQADVLLQKAQEEAQALKIDAAKRAEEEGQVAVNQARTQAQDIMQQAERAKEQLLAEINERIERRASIKAGELLTHCLPDDFMNEVHGRWVKDLLDKGFGHVDRLHIPPEVKEIKVVSAFRLTPEQKTVLAQKLEQSLGRRLEFHDEEDRSLVAGLVIHAGSIVLDGTLVNKIKEKMHNGSALLERT
jgi:F-type H+-transporting ATPase subunit b